MCVYLCMYVYIIFCPNFFSHDFFIFGKRIGTELINFLVKIIDIIAVSMLFTLVNAESRFILSLKSWILVWCHFEDICYT